MSIWQSFLPIAHRTCPLLMSSRLIPRSNAPMLSPASPWSSICTHTKRFPFCETDNMTKRQRKVRTDRNRAVYEAHSVHLDTFCWFAFQDKTTISSHILSPAVISRQWNRKREETTCEFPPATYEVCLCLYRKHFDKYCTTSRKGTSHHALPLFSIKGKDRTYFLGGIWIASGKSKEFEKSRTSLMKTELFRLLHSTIIGDSYKPCETFRLPYKLLWVS